MQFYMQSMPRGPFNLQVWPWHGFTDWQFALLRCFSGTLGNSLPTGQQLLSCDSQQPQQQQQQQQQKHLHHSLHHHLHLPWLKTCISQPIVLRSSAGFSTYEGSMPHRAARSSPTAHQHAKQYGLQTRDTHSDDEDVQASTGFRQQWRQQWQQQRDQQLSSIQRAERRNDSKRRAERRSADDKYDVTSPMTTTSHRNKPWQQPERRPQRPQGAVVMGSRLTKAITSASTLAELQKILDKHTDQIQQIHLCAAFKAVVRLSVGLNAHTSSQGDEVQQYHNAASTAQGVDSHSSAKAMPTHGSTALALLRQLSKHTQQQIRVARPWDLAQAAWACSKLQYRDRQLLDGIAQHAVKKAAILTPHDISQLASAYARLSYPQKHLSAMLLAQSVAKVHDFPPWVLVHTAWALHICGLNVRELLLPAVQRLSALEQMQQLKDIDLSSLLWLLADYQVYDATLLQSAAKHMATNIGTYSAASTANALMACAALGFTTEELSAAAQAAVKLQQQQQLQRLLQLHTITPRHVTQSVFALAKLKACDQQMLQMAAKTLEQGSHSFSPPSLSMLVWVGVLAGQPLPDGFAHKLVQCSRDRLNDFSADQLVSLLRGVIRISTQQHDSQDMLRWLFAEAQPLLYEKLSTISTPVLTTFIISLSKHLKQQQPSLSEAPAYVSPNGSLVSGLIGTDSASSSTDTSTVNSSLQSQVLTVEGQETGTGAGQLLLLQCVEEWTRPSRHSQLTLAQAIAVNKEVESCGAEHLAAAVQQVVAAVRQAGKDDKGAAASAEDGTAVGSGPSPAEAVEDSQQEAPGNRGTWVDSFVASTT